MVHHTGKDATKGLRGHSSLFAALDSAIEVTKTEYRRTWSLAKSKDDATGNPHSFKLEVVTLGTDEHADFITSCVAVADTLEHDIRRVKLPVKGNQKIALDALNEALRSATDFGEAGAPQGCPCVKLDEALGLVTERIVCDSKHKTSRAREALQGLVSRGIFRKEGVWLWPIGCTNKDSLALPESPRLHISGAGNSGVVVGLDRQTRKVPDSGKTGQAKARKY